MGRRRLWMAPKFYYQKNTLFMTLVQFQTILLSYKLCVIEKSKQMEILYFLMVMLSLLLDKLP